MLRYGRPSKQLVVIGVTGTDGKTTSTTLLYEILKASGKNVAMINGLRFCLPSKEWKNHSDNSTPGRMIIRRFLRQAVNEGCDVVILEVTSWGIEQYRVWGIAFDVVAFTNFTYEHLDLHETMERYRAMKGRLFAALSSARKHGQPKVSVINQDDPEAGFFSSYHSDRTIRYSTATSADVYATDIHEDGGVSFILHHENQKSSVQLNLHGVFNVDNALTAACCALAVGASLEQIKTGLERVTLVSGRMEAVDMGQPFKVIVDFAHTPNGFRNLFESARKMSPKGKIIAVYGATGDRDPGRRPMVGKLAGELIDFSVLTTEDPHTEDPREIAVQVEAGLQQAGRHEGPDYTYIEDRTEAIYRACSMAQAGDVVLLCSMGDYDVMYVGHGKIAWSDRDAAKQALSRLGFGSKQKQN